MFNPPPQYGRHQHGQHPRYQPPEFQQSPPQYPQRFDPPDEQRLNPTQRRRTGAWGYVWLVVVLIIGGVFVTSLTSKSNPDIGDCLTSMEDRFFGGLDIVDCSSGQARFEVVQKHSGDDGPRVCKGQPQGRDFDHKGRHGNVIWQLCAVPK